MVTYQISDENTLLAVFTEQLDPAPPPAVAQCRAEASGSPLTPGDQPDNSKHLQFLPLLTRTEPSQCLFD